MSTVHGKNTVIKVTCASPAPTGAIDISFCCNTSAFNEVRDSHDVTCYGATGHAYADGLTNHTFSLGGVYDTSTSTGARAIFGALMSSTGGQLISIERQVEGTGTGKPKDTFSGLVTSYTETNPAADMVTWTAEVQISGAVTRTTQ